MFALFFAMPLLLASSVLAIVCFAYADEATQAYVKQVVQALAFFLGLPLVMTLLFAAPILAQHLTH